MKKLLCRTFFTIFILLLVWIGEVKAAERQIMGEAINTETNANEPMLLSERASSGNSTVCVKGTFDYEQAYRVLEIVNKERAKEGKSALIMDKELLDTAMLRASELSICYLSSHNRPTNEACFTAFPNRTLIYAGENIAAGYLNAEHVMERLDGFRRT